MFIEKAKQLIDRHTIISFDIFDTLLLRPYLRPSDTFVHLEQIHHLPDFAEHRRQAEKRARKKRPKVEDVTFDEIYAELSGPQAQLKDQELALERQTLQPNQQLLEIFRYARKKGKKIIIVSDMYLPAAFLETVLHEKGFDGFEKLYVSNGPRKTKSSGSLYHFVQEDLQVNPATILHIGDNARSDVRRAQKAGWHALHYPSAQFQFFRQHKRAQKFWEKYPTFATSVVLGTLVIQSQQPQEKNYFSRLGFETAGPVAYAFTRWIEREALRHNTVNLLFAARDGYSLQRIFETFDNPKISSAYVYALRFLKLLCCLDYAPSSANQMKTILHYFAPKIPALQQEFSAKKSWTKADMHQLIQKYKATLTPLSNQELARYKAYLQPHIKQLGLIGVVDSITASFSAQKLIESVMGTEQVVGYYWSVVTSPEANKHAFVPFLPVATSHEFSATFTHRWNFMEFLFTAPQPPIKNITPDGKPIHADKIPPQEQGRITAYKTLSDGMLAFAQEIHRIFAGKDIFLTADFALAWVNWFLLHPTAEDEQEMAHIFHASDNDHTEFEPLLSYRPTLAEIFRAPKQYITFTKQVYWKTPFQFLLTCILSPVAMETRGPGQRFLCFFPRLRKQYFRWGIGKNGLCYGISWGRRRD